MVQVTGHKLWAGVIPAPDQMVSSEKQAVDDAASSSGFSLGSDALTLPWYSKQHSGLDMTLCCNLACMALAVLHRMKRYHTVVQVCTAYGPHTLLSITAEPILVPCVAALLVVSVLLTHQVWRWTKRT